MSKPNYFRKGKYSVIPHIDWLTYNTTTGVKIDNGLPSAQYPKSRAARDALEVFPDCFRLLLDYEIVLPRKPFQWALQCITTKLRVSGRYPSPVAHVEVPGRACDILQKSGHLDAVTVDRGPLLTRLDVAVDFKTETKPGKMALSFANKNFRSRSRIVSPKGTTEYIGSWKSDRFARVYRYNPPTPRWEYLRLEFVFKRQHARNVAAFLGVGGWPALLSAIGDIYDIKHPLWTDGIETVPGSSADIAWNRERQTSTTLRWLERQAMPSVVRLVQSGELSDIDDWLKNQVYDKLTTSND